ncbi:sensor histidine kinase [Nocardiopsis ansamitocini]|uniref:histidine kinase n=1 Tax=Nocardiopsis ansamitocini TaxID=1670832 RepID=A0A9W6UID4_9ACTN|nr:HAMP domain-containing sensor histidine kinase [Nocardiopsis ansamitocini]GLU47582.1 two-component sensor histidine kinase [Nocardiopsis ansamitocini]
MSVAAVLGRSRLSVRLRLTLLYGGTVLVCGIVLLAAVYALMRYLPIYELPTEGRLMTAIPANAEHVPADTLHPTRVTIAGKDDILAALLQVSGVAITGLALVAFLLGWIIAGRILTPVHRITRAARAMAGDTLHKRIRLDGPPDEFTELADSIDMMLDRLHASFQAQRRFAANASHELRTPLATTRTMLQVAAAHPDDYNLASLVPKLLATNDRSIATVESLLALSRADHGVTDARPVDLAAVAAGALEQVEAEAASARIDVHDDCVPVQVDGDADLLHHLLVNLLHNAIRHNSAGGTARLTTTLRDGNASITVTNTGETLRPEEAARLFEPFHRARGRTGTDGHGLGLTLVRAIADSHHGSATAVPNPGGGLTVVVLLPLANGKDEGNGPRESGGPALLAASRSRYRSATA